MKVIRYLETVQRYTGKSIWREKVPRDGIAVQGCVYMKGEGTSRQSKQVSLYGTWRQSTWVSLYDGKRYLETEYMGKSI